MIVAVEGPSAAGKTTWCRAQPWPVVPEYTPTGREPDGADKDQQAQYWVQVDAGRWERAVELERNSRVVICDSDPVKLHYSWCLARVGAAPWSRFLQELGYVRTAFADGRLGFGDAVIVSIPPMEVLREHKKADTTRQRRSFELHARLAEPLREWYVALERVGPGRVVWSLPATGIPAHVEKRPQRCDVDLLDRLVKYLPAGGREDS
ncbi:hypothetical protein [Mycobacterium kyogaense]|uniref:hypothetical protein n=1 Tax=Mycobacterium kyogaense TaxID=2212479 RepID=UPI000DACFDEF|nr:hypothetical protein [Mycobacterium kyogaense]